MGILARVIGQVEDKNLHTYGLVGTTIALLLLGAFILWIKEWPIHGPTGFPIVGIESPGYFARAKARREFVFNGFQMVRDAYYKHYGKNFVITTNSFDRIVLTHDQIKEVSYAPENTFSFSHAIGRTFLIEYTRIDLFVETQYIRDATKMKLTQNLGSMGETLLEEARFALKAELPESTDDEWVSVDIFTAVERIVARINARSFVGLYLCRNEAWLAVSINYTGDLLKTIVDLGSVSKLFRPFYAFMWNPSKNIDSHKKRAESLLAPIIQERLEERKFAEKSGTSPKNHNDLLHWLIDLVEPDHKTVEILSELQLLAGVTSILTTSLALVNMILDLSEYQECIQPIREEIEAAITANGRVLDRGVLREMRRADSFVKESMRIRDSLFSYNRLAMKNTTLSDGTYLRKGTMLSAPTSMLATDPSFVENAETFDGFRWYRKSLELKEDSMNRNSCTATSTNILSFGHGRHACPGRFYAVEEMKIILIFLLLQYDIKYPEGESRPLNIEMGEYSIPDRAQKLMFKKRPGPKKFSFL